MNTSLTPAGTWTAPPQRFVALGDSFTEGVGDHDPTRPNGVRGWADRTAEQLSTFAPDFGYANLAIRGRLLQPILDEQVEPTLALEPDLITIYAGANDILRPKVDIDAIVERYDGGIARLATSGARLLVFTGFDPGWAPVFGRTRGRVAVYNELVREVAERHGAEIVDYWRMREFRDERMWDTDRMHMSAAGHRQMAIRVLETLGAPTTLHPEELPELPKLSPSEQRRADLVWAKEFAAPWVKRRLTGTSSGDGLSARRPRLEPIGRTEP